VYHESNLWGCLGFENRKTKNAISMASISTQPIVSRSTKLVDYEDLEASLPDNNKLETMSPRRSGRPPRLLLSVLAIALVTVAIGTCAHCFSRRGTYYSRYDMILRRILREGVSTRAHLSLESSPQHAALKWLASVDPAQMDPKDTYLVQRYALAVFWFASHDQTTVKRIIASDPDNNTNEGSVANLDLTWSNETNWMSSNGHCNWFGISCRPQQESTPSKRQFNYDGSSDVLAFIMPNNKIRGLLPDELFVALSSLQMLVLDDNVLFGSIPKTLAHASHLQVLSLENNLLSGRLSSASSLQKLSNLIDLNLSDNELHGTIPSEISQLERLGAVYLDGNHLSGTIPSSWGLFPNLVDLRLSNNQLVGSIPSDLGRVTSLLVLELDHNDLTGTIPSEMGSLVSLMEFELDHNRLHGTIPSEVGNLVKAQTLYLDHNRLSGSIPSSIHLMHELSKSFLVRTRRI
jgi:Leucine-rich repeat (LRR) protein